MGPEGTAGSMRGWRSAGPVLMQATGGAGEKTTSTDRIPKYSLATSHGTSSTKEAPLPENTPPGGYTLHKHTPLHRLSLSLQRPLRPVGPVTPGCTPAADLPTPISLHHRSHRSVGCRMILSGFSGSGTSKMIERLPPSFTWSTDSIGHLLGKFRPRPHS